MIHNCYDDDDEEENHDDEDNHDKFEIFADSVQSYSTRL